MEWFALWQVRVAQVESPSFCYLSQSLVYKLLKEMSQKLPIIINEHLFLFSTWIGISSWKIFESAS